jgi:allophanate hydrolase
MMVFNLPQRCAESRSAYIESQLTKPMVTTYLDSLDFATVSAHYASGRWTPSALIAAVLDRIAGAPDTGIWINRFPAEHVREQARRVEERRARGEKLSLYGLPFAVKDNIDVAGLPTTAACPAFAIVAERSAPVVQRILDAGGIFIGKTNLDQFAAGLVGVRSPFGVCKNTFDGRYISGGSSSGSAAAVAAGLVSFSLGTDTAGSGRVPAAFNNIIGLKPTRGLLSTLGVVPACRSLDCISVFALTCEDAEKVESVATAFTEGDPYSRHADELAAPRAIGDGPFRFGVPAAKDLDFFGDESAAALFSGAVNRLKSLGGVAVEIDLEPFLQVGRLLYEGPWLAERLEAPGMLLKEDPEAILPVTRKVLSGADRYSAADAFVGMHALAGLQQQTAPTWKKIDFLLAPTAGTIHTIAAVEADPVRLNSTLGRYTNFVNLLDLCGLALPAGFGSNGLPYGVTIIAPAGHDRMLLQLGERYQRSANFPLGATKFSLPTTKDGQSQDAAKPRMYMRGSEGSEVLVAVVGAHLSGQPLNFQLTERNAVLARSCRTAAKYRLFALPGTKPPKPGLIRVASGGAAIDVEVWQMAVEAFGSFVAAIPSPLGIGSLELEDGTHVKGFICEEFAVASARDISTFGSWRKYLAES